ncbi:MAG: HAMP domain-containing histidine kinase [Firmicutes bacterium]|nr:HAMP domain-containing histidine kinase [Bacillota bacterium]
MAIISRTKTRRRNRKFFFSIRWKILIAFLFILGVSFYVVATSLIGLVSDYMSKTRINAERATVERLARQFAPLFSRGDAAKLYIEALKASQELEGRLLVVDMDGKVQIDTFSQLNGQRIAHPEVVAVLGGGGFDYGFHLVTRTREIGSRAFFDFLRSDQTDQMWAGYFASTLELDGTRYGALLYSNSVQDMMENLRVIQDQMLLCFFAAAIAVFGISLVFSQIITKPIATLTEGIKRMARGDLSSRVEVKGTDEMARMSETFNRMSEKLENLDISRNEFISNASHELKTPLATMKILLESVLYQEDMDPALRAEFMTDMDSELDRLSQIVSDLLTLVQSDAHHYQIKRQNILLAALVEDTLRRLHTLAREKGQTLNLIAPAEIPIFADPVKLQQIVYNLVENAIKYSPKGGRIRVTVSQESKFAVLEVSDTGPGIPAKDQPHIFDRFYRVDKARARATGGNGLGLSIVHQAVMMHGGNISVYSEEGRGATFRVELPL